MEEQYFFCLGIKSTKPLKKTQPVAQLMHKTTSSLSKTYFYGDLLKKSNTK